MGEAAGGQAMTQEIQQAAQWLEHEAQRIRYGEAVIRVTLHDGQVRGIERTVTEKVRPE